MIVFTAVFATYSLSGMCLFGKEVEEFASIYRAANCCFLMLLGEFDWQALKDVGKPRAYVWFWTYNVIVVWIMFNMVVAILMDAYVEIKGHVGDHSDTLWSEAAEL